MTEVLLPCPFCGAEMHHRFALWPSDGDRDAIVHAQPTECGMIGFSIETADGGKTVAEAWNRRTAGQAEQIAWRGGEPPKDGSVFYGHSWSPCRWKEYSPKSEQFRRGVKGRWQAMNEFGGWDNAPAPDEWADTEQVEARRQALAPLSQSKGD